VRVAALNEVGRLRRVERAAREYLVARDAAMHAQRAAEVVRHEAVEAAAAKARTGLLMALNALEKALAGAPQEGQREGGSEVKFKSPVLEGYPVREHKLGSVPGAEWDEMSVVRWSEDSFLSRLVLDEDERRRVAERGELFIFHYSIGDRFLPLRAQVERPVFTLPVFSVEGVDETPRLFDGFDVRAAGGTEAERLEYAGSEAAEFAAAAVRLPARVALLREGLPWLEGGGEECKAYEKLVSALASRLGSMTHGDTRPATPAGPLRLELHDAVGAVVIFSVAEALAPECVETAQPRQ
jgi:hypothetical protein